MTGKLASADIETCQYPVNMHRPIYNMLHKLSLAVEIMYFNGFVIVLPLKISWKNPELHFSCQPREAITYFISLLATRSQNSLVNIDAMLTIV